MYDRRRILKLGGLALTGSLAGCQAPTSDDGGSTPTPTETDTATETPTPTATATPGTQPFEYGGWLDETGNYDGETVDARGQSPVTIAVGAEGNGGAFAFAPPAVWIDLGTTVRWEWTGEGGSHNVVAESGAAFRSGDPTSDSSTTFEQTFDEPGIITYFCSPHEGLGMKGAIAVGNAESGG